MGEACLTVNEELPPPTGKGPSRPAVVIPHNGSAPHALFYDLTHDNETYLHKRSAEDALSTGALVTFSWSAIASVKGFDDLYPSLLDLVNEKRHYEVMWGLAFPTRCHLIMIGDRSGREQRNSKGKNGFERPPCGDGNSRFRGGTCASRK